MRMIEHLVMQAAVHDSVTHAEDVAFRQRLRQSKMSIRTATLADVTLYGAFIQTYLIASGTGEADQVEDGITGPHD